MYATNIHARQNNLLWAMPADRKPISERRAGEGMLADEVFNARPSLAARYAEATLMCAVLEDAVDCFQKQFGATRRGKHLGREAEQWLFATSPIGRSRFSPFAVCSSSARNISDKDSSAPTTAFRNRLTSIGLLGEGRPAEILQQVLKTIRSPSTMLRASARVHRRSAQGELEFTGDFPFVLNHWKHDPLVSAVC